MPDHPNYYTVNNNDTMSAWDVLAYILKLPYTLLKWVVSFLLSRPIAHVTLSPELIRRQRDIHFVKLSVEDPENDASNIVDPDDIVIVNLAKHAPNKSWNDFFLKFSRQFFRVPFVTETKIYDHNNSDDKAHLDQMIEKVGELLQGRSTAKHCQDKTFAGYQIHLKGIEYLTQDSYAYLINELQTQFGYNYEQAHQASTKCDINFFSLEAADGSVTDSLEVCQPAEKAKQIEDRKFIIACMARTQPYIATMSEFKSTAEKTDATVISFNYRGVDHSKGIVWTQENMVNDVLAQVQRLRDMGVPAENIGLEGMCAGALVATLAAAHLHERGDKVHLFNERAPRSIFWLTIGFILPDAQSSYWNPMTYIRYFVAGVVGLIIAPFIWLAGWEMNAEKAWDRIPFEYKDYSYVRDANNPEVADGIVNYSWASMGAKLEAQYSAVKMKPKASLTADEWDILADNPTSHGVRDDTPDDRYTESKPRKLPHNMWRRDLTLSSNPGLNGQDYTTNSFKRRFYPTTWEATEITTRPLMIACNEGSAKDVYERTLGMLVDAAQMGQAYSKVVSTQSVALGPVCDAVRDYNQYYRPAKEKRIARFLPELRIEQSLPEASASDYSYFVNSLRALQPEQRTTMSIFASDVSTLANELGEAHGYNIVPVAV